MFCKKHSLFFYVISLFFYFEAISCSVIINNSDNSDPFTIQGRNLIIGYDDSQLTDYTKMYPIHKTYNVPAEINVWIKAIDFTNSSTSQLTIQQLQEMYANGFDVLSHTTSHVSLGRAVLLSPVNKGDLLIHTNIDVTFTNSAGLTYDLHDGINTEVITIDHYDKVNKRVVLKYPLINSYLPYNTVCELTADSLIYELEYSQNVLLKNFSRCVGLVYPFSLYCEKSLEFVNHTYLTARTALPQVNENNIFNCIYEDKIDKPLEIVAIDFTLLSEEQIVQIFEHSKCNNFVIFLYSHSYTEICSPERIEFVINEALKRNITITTISKLFHLNN